VKRDFSVIVCDLDGEPVRLGAGMETIMAAVNEVFPKLTPEMQKLLNETIVKHAGKELTFGAACVGALMGAYEDERSLDDDTRFKRMELARKIHNGGVVEIEPKDRDLIKPLLKKRYNGILVPVTVAELLETDLKE